MTHAPATIPPLPSRALAPGGVRMTDIARRAGVSVATVSRALMGSDRVAEGTRRRVEAAAEDLGYTLNHAARSLRTQRTGLVLAIVPDIGNTFFSYVLAGIEEEAQRLGYAVLIGNVAGDAARARAYGERLLAGMADGAILLDGQLPDPAWVGRPEAMALPLVALCERIRGADLPTVAIDDRGAARDATAHLLALGRRRVAHVTAAAGTVLMEDRLAGYRDALAAVGLPFEPDLVAPGDLTIGGGASAWAALARRRPDVDAAFCGNDETAMGVINAARRAGRRVPEDLAVAGFDGLEFGEAFFPPLTSVVQPRVELGTAAMRLLHERIGKPDVPARHVILDAILAIRGSTMRQGP